MELTPKLKKAVLAAQKSEITEFFVYKKLAKYTPLVANKKILNRIADDEMRHHDFWKSLTKEKVSPSRTKIFLFTFAAHVLGLTFSVRLMERGEDFAQKTYKKLTKINPHVEQIIKDEEEHEQSLISVLKTKELQYMGSIVLGLSDALVELTGALAGLTLALQNTRLIMIVGLITGIAASLSMAASEYLSTKEEDGENPIKAALITGITYLITVALLITPFFIATNPFVALGTSLGIGVIIIFLFTFYSAVARNLSFKKKFFEMVSISLAVAAINFFIGYVIKQYFGIDA